MVMSWKWIRISLLVVGVTVLAACASTNNNSGPSGSNSTPAGAPGTVTVKRTGGFAGVNDTLVVAPDGKWTSTNKAGARHSGQLNADQTLALKNLLTASEKSHEMGQQAAARSNCSDAFRYTIAVAEGSSVAWYECPTDPNQPMAARAIVALLSAAGAL
jgi:hypothetical protein